MRVVREAAHLDWGGQHMVTSRKVKAAWIRRQDVPAGQPATGHFDCECGRNVQAGILGEGPDIQCECGITYSNTGWIRQRQEAKPRQ